MDIVFINNLQVPCILGMDYLQAAGIVIDAGAKSLHFKPAYTDQPYDNAFNISIKTDQDITLQPMEETKIIFNTPTKLKGKAYICSHPQLPENLNVMDGVIASNNMEKCAAVILNSSSSPYFSPKQLILLAFSHVQKTI